MSRLHGDGINQPIGGYLPVAYTPTVTWPGNTITTQSGFYMKEPGKLTVWVSFIESAGTASAVCTITIPTGYTAVTMAGSLAMGVGVLVRASTPAAILTIQCAAGATTQVTVPASSGVVDTWNGTFVIPTLT